MIRRLKKWLRWLRFGRITCETKQVVQGVSAEEEYRDCRGRVIGYWAHGHWDPQYPYQGNEQ